MSPRGRLLGRAASLVLVASIGAGSFALTASAASHGSVAAASKKCKRKHHRKKRRCKRRAVPAPAMIAISPASQDFGITRQPEGATGTFTVTNAGGSPSGLPVPTLTGPDAASFSISANTCTNLLAPAAACRIDVHLPPTGPLGVKSATLNVMAVPGGMVSASFTGDVED
jgi:hypothetical protein